MKQIKVDASFLEPNQRLNIKKDFDIKQVNRILVQGIDQLGGLAMSTPFFRELRMAFPNAFIVNLVGPLTLGLMQNCPYIDEAWLFNKKESFKLIKKVREAKFDITFLASGTLRTALISFLAGIPNRVGYDEDGTAPLLTVQLHQQFSSRYRPENIFDMLRAVGVSPNNIYERENWFSQQDQQYAENWNKENRQLGKKIFLFNPFSTDPKRRWTNQGWTKLLQALQELNVLPIMMVAPNEVVEAKKLLKTWSQESIAVQSYSVTKTAAILAQVDIVMGPESGFVHLALGANKPNVVAIFNVLPVRSTFPVGDARHIGLIKNDLSCAPCYLYRSRDVCPYDLRCMKELGADTVLDAIKKFL